MADQGNSIEPYRLPLEDEDLFPSFEGLPNEYTGDISEAAVQGGMWYLVCEIVSNESLMRPMYRVRDTAGKLSLLAFYLNNGNKDAARVAKFRTGTTLVIEQPWAKIFMDGQHGIRLEDEDVNTVTNLPCSLAELRESHKYLRAAPKECKGCGKQQPAKRCSRCLVPYCGAECQQKTWPNHKSECKVFVHLRGLSEELDSYGSDSDDLGDYSYDDSYESGSGSDHKTSSAHSHGASAEP